VAGVRTAWLTLDSGDGDLDSLVRGVVDAMRIHVARLPMDLTSAMDAGDADLAVRFSLRLLEQDRYDEETHLGLVRTLLAAGRHCEAHRRYQQYVAQMAEIGVEPAALPTPFSRR
jgi:hypothetical protein